MGEARHPESPAWETRTFCFEQENVHFYVNQYGFKMDRFRRECFQPDHRMPDDGEHEPNEGADELLRLI